MFVKAIKPLFYGNKFRHPVDPENGTPADIFKLVQKTGKDKDGQPFTYKVEDQFDPNSMEKIKVARVASVDQQHAEEDAERERIAIAEAEEAQEIAEIQSQLEENPSAPVQVSGQEEAQSTKEFVSGESKEMTTEEKVAGDSDSSGEAGTGNMEVLG